VSETRDPVHGADAERWGGWSWRDPRDGEHFRTCSYCGSIHPADLAAEIERGLPQRGEFPNPHWADAKYGWPHKQYVDIPNRAPERKFIVSATNTSTPPNSPAAYSWIPSGEIPPDVVTNGWRDVAEHYTWVALGTRATHHAKFYTTHLADPQISAEVLEQIQRASGRRFRFEDGRVSWGPYESTE
jgi:hypothetical protein